jgi:hypothetical protein
LFFSPFYGVEKKPFTSSLFLGPFRVTAGSLLGVANFLFFALMMMMMMMMMRAAGGEGKREVEWKSGDVGI